MPTVPNWIPRAWVLLPSRGTSRPDEIVRTVSWRPTPTQVVVTLDNPKRTELRFWLDGLRPVGHENRRAELLDGDAPETQAMVARIRAEEAVADFETVLNVTRMDHVRDDREAQARLIGQVRDAATAALAALEPLL
jgi:hypothetical protein